MVYSASAIALMVGLSLLTPGCMAAPPAESTSATKPPVTVSSPSSSSPSSSLNSAPVDIAAAPDAATQGQELPITATATIGDVVIELEVAETPEQQSLGLMFRPSLPDNRGMLFPFERPRFTRFWMRNVEISLDMIFMSGDEVISIDHDVPPCREPICPTYGPDALVTQVIELRGGRAAELGLEVGDRITIVPIVSNSIVPD
jgi:uncharacterized membrane protein (UPF0127 family)